MSIFIGNTPIFQAQNTSLSIQSRNSNVMRLSSTTSNTYIELGNFLIGQQNLGSNTVGFSILNSVTQEALASFTENSVSLFKPLVSTGVTQFTNEIILDCNLVTNTIISSNILINNGIKDVIRLEATGDIYLDGNLNFGANSGEYQLYMDSNIFIGGSITTSNIYTDSIANNPNRDTFISFTNDTIRLAAPVVQIDNLNLQGANNFENIIVRGKANIYGEIESSNLILYNKASTSDGNRNALRIYQPLNVGEYGDFRFGNPIAVYADFKSGETNQSIFQLTPVGQILLGTNTDVVGSDRVNYLIQANIPSTRWDVMEGFLDYRNSNINKDRFTVTRHGLVGIGKSTNDTEISMLDIVNNYEGTEIYYSPPVSMIQLRNKHSTNELPFLRCKDYTNDIKFQVTNKGTLCFYDTPYDTDIYDIESAKTGLFGAVETASIYSLDGPIDCYQSTLSNILNIYTSNAFIENAVIDKLVTSNFSTPYLEGVNNNSELRLISGALLSTASNVVFNANRLYFETTPSNKDNLTIFTSGTSLDTVNAINVSGNNDEIIHKIKNTNTSFNARVSHEFEVNTYRYKTGVIHKPGIITGANAVMYITPTDTNDTDILNTASAINIYNNKVIKFNNSAIIDAGGRMSVGGEATITSYNLYTKGTLAVADNDNNIIFNVIDSGQVGIGTSATNSEKLFVSGGILKCDNAIITEDQFIAIPYNDPLYPEYTWSSSPATGLYLPVANTIGIVINQTERVRVNTLGNVGIGNQDPLFPLDVTGTARATTYIGSGAGLTNLNGANIGTGAVPVARGGTGATAVTGSGDNVLSISPTFTGTVNAATINATLYNGSGAGLTNLNGANIGTGAVPIARGGTGATAVTGSGDNVLSNSPTFTGTVNAATISATLYNGSGAGLANINGANIGTGAVPVARGGTGATAVTGTGDNVLSISPTFTGTVTAATINATLYNGSGAGLTNLNAANIGTGVLTVARGGTGVTNSTGSGSVVLSESPIFTGTLGAAAINASSTVTGTRVISTISNGTAPLTVTSTTVVTNLNADLLDGQEGTYYRNATNINNGTLSTLYGGTGASDTTPTGTGKNVLSASPTLTGTVNVENVTASGGITAVSFTGSGAGLTNINAANIGIGTIPIEKGGTGATAITGTGNNVLSISPSITGTMNAVNITASGTVAANAITVTSTGLVTNLNADLLDSQDGSYYRNATNINAGTLSALYGGTGATDTTPTGSGKNVLSAAPTFTGTVNAANITATGTIAANAFSVTSTGLVTNLNADLLDGQDGSYYLNVGNTTAGILGTNNGGTGTTSVTGSGSLVKATSPTFTGTVNAAAITSSSTITASTFSGSGSGLSSLNAANIGTGTLSPLYGGTGASDTTPTGTGKNVLSISPTFTGTVGAAAITASGTVTANLFSGSGASITNLNAGNFSSGTLSVGRGGIGTNTLPATQFLLGNGTNAITSATGLFWDNVNKRLGVGVTTPSYPVDVLGNIYATGTIFASNISLIGGFSNVETTTTTTSQIIVDNTGTGPALKVTQSGNNSIAEFYDFESGIAVFMANSGLVGIGKTNPATALDVSGTVTATVFSGSGASLNSIPNSATTATNISNGNTIVSRDGSGNFAAGTITATLNGNASTATTLQNSRTIWGQSFNGSGNVSGNITNAGTIQFGTQANKGTLTYITNTARTFTVPDPGGNADFVMTSGDQSISGTKTFNSTISGSITGNAGTVTNGVYTSRSIGTGDGLSGGGNLSADRTLTVDGTVVRTTGNQTIGGIKTFTSTISGSIDGNASSVTNGVYISRTVSAGDGLTGGGDLSANRSFAVDTSVVRTSGSQTIGGVKTFSLTITGDISGNAGSVTNGVYTSRNVNTGDGLSGGGNLSADRTITVDGTVVRTTGNQTIGGIKTFTSTITGDISGNAGSVTNGVYTSRTISAGDGLSGGGNLSADRSLSVDSSVVRTSGNQTIGGVKTFTSAPIISHATESLSFNDSGTTKRGINGLCGGSDYWFFGGGATSTNAGFLEISTGDDAGSEPIYVRQYNGTPLAGTITRTLTLLDGSGNSSFPGTVSASVFSGSGASLTSIPNSATTATNVSNGNTIVLRDGSGNFSAGTITATLSGTATQVSQTLTRGSYLTGNNYNGSAATTWAVNADTANIGSTIVARDGSGNFAAGTITATLNGNASTATTAGSATNATNATNIGITNDTTTNSTHYITFTSGTSGNNASKVSSTKLTFNPSTGVLTSSGGFSGTATNVSGIVAIANGGTGTNSVGTANVVFASPNGTTGAPSFRALVAADIPTLNQNTTGTAGNVTGIVAIANGGTGTNSVGTANVVFASPNGTTGAPLFRALVAADIPTLNQNTTGTAGGLSGTPNITVGTISSTSITTNNNNINAGTGTITGNGSGLSSLNGTNISIGTVSAARIASLNASWITAGVFAQARIPALNASWINAGVFAAARIPTLNQNTTGTAANVTGTVAVANGGTGRTTLTANKVLVGNGTTGILQPTNLHWDNTNSRLGISATSPSYALHVTGDVFATGDVIAYSDSNIKCNLEPIENALDKLMQLTGYTFNFKDRPDEKRHAGLMAQDVQKVLPEVVHTAEEDNTLSLAYGNMSALIINAIKELQKDVQKIKTTLNIV